MRIKKQIPISILILAVLLLVLATLPVASATITYVVKQDGSGDNTTIQAAVDAVSTSRPLPDTYIIEVQDSGTYHESVNAWREGSATHPFIIRAKAGETPTVVSVNTGGSADHYCFKVGHWTTIDGFKITNGGSYGIALWDNTLHNTIKNCIIYGNGKGIHFDNSDYSEALNNTIYGNDYGIYVGKCSDSNTIKGNLVYSNSNTGIIIRCNNYNIVANNVIHDNTIRGILIYDNEYGNAKENKIFNNTLYHNSKEVQLGTGSEGNNCGSNNVIKNNILYASSGGTGIAVDSYGDPGTLPSGTVLNYNDIYAPSGNVGYIDTNTYTTLSDWQTGSGQDANSISSDPLFVNPTTDYHLQSTAGSYHGGAWTADTSTSPGIDAGDPSDSYGNEPEPNGDRVNMGAYGNTAEASKSLLVTSCDKDGDEVNQFAPGENVSVKGTGLDASTAYKIWIQNDPVEEGYTLTAGNCTNCVGVVQETDVTTDAQGNFSAKLIWSIPGSAAVTSNEYDIVVDNQVGGNVGTYNAADDGMDSATVAGIVAPVPDVSSLVLFASGLVLVSVYFVYGRRGKVDKKWR